MDASDVIAIVALGVSLAAAALTYKLGRHTFNVTTYHQASDRTLEMDQVFIEYPALRPYFYDGEPVPEADSDPELRQRVLAIAEFVVDVLEDLWDKKECYDGPDRDAWRDWIWDVFATSPACCEHYAQSIRWYPTLEGLFEHDGPLPVEVQRAIAAHGGDAC